MRGLFVATALMMPFVGCGVVDVASEAKVKSRSQASGDAEKEIPVLLPNDPPADEPLPPSTLPGASPSPSPTASPSTSPTPSPSPSPGSTVGTNPIDPKAPIPELPPIVPGNPIKNPYYQNPTWKLWAKNSTPVTLPNNATIALPTTAEQRLFPDMAAVVPNPGHFLPIKTGASDRAGFWDDFYKTEDNGHSNIPTSWQAPGSTTVKINLAGQFGIIPTANAGSTNNITAGVNFTSQSTTCMGHNHVSSYQLTSNEQNYFFANVLRGGPAYYSFRDHLADRTIDSYKGLPLSGHHSFGRSSSEVVGLFKMVVAGGFLPRGVKDLVKHHGVYPSVLHYIYTASLPYANADGTPVDYLNELRHRPGFLSNGSSTNSEFMPYNQWYHRYPEAAHLDQMTQMAAGMAYPPPVAILKFENVERVLNGATTNSTTHGEKSKTSILVPFQAGEKVTVTVDVSESFDLGTQPLTYRWHVLYPEQKNVTITKLSDTRYKIAMTHNAALPKMRIPVLLTASNGIFESSPAQVSFYPAGPNPGCSSYELGANTANEMNVNLRPTFATTPDGDMSTPKGGTVSFALACSDPEGFPVTYYRWLGEPGTLAGNNVTLTTTAADAGKTIALHFICSDGTGGYNSLEKKIVVQP